MRLESFALRNRKTKSWLKRIVAISSINLIVSYNEPNLELRRCDRDRKKKEIARNLSENLPFGEACHARFSPICVANIFALYSSITAVRARERESTHLANRVTIVTGFSRSRDLTYRSIRCFHGIKLIWTCVHFFSPFFFFSLSPLPLSLSRIFVQWRNVIIENRFDSSLSVEYRSKSLHFVIIFPLFCNVCCWRSHQFSWEKKFVS